MKLKVLCSARLAMKSNILASCGISQRPPIHSFKRANPSQPSAAPCETLCILSLLTLSVPLSSLLSPARSLCLAVILKGHPHLARHAKWTVKSHLSLCLWESVCVCVPMVDHLVHFLNIINRYV